jgi:hypothetical protein
MIKDKYLEDNGKTFDEGNGFIDPILKYKKVEGAVYTENGISNFVSKEDTLYTVNKSYFEKCKYFTEFKDCTKYSEYSKKDGETITTEYYDTDENLLFVREQGFKFSFRDGSPISGLCIDTAYFPYTDTYYQGDQITKVNHFEYGYNNYTLKETESYEDNTKTVTTYEEKRGENFPKTIEVYVDDVLVQRSIYKSDRIHIYLENESYYKDVSVLQSIEYYEEEQLDRIEYFSQKEDKDISNPNDIVYLNQITFYKDGLKERNEYLPTPYDSLPYKRVSYSSEFYDYPPKDKIVLDYNGSDVDIIDSSCIRQGRQLYDITISTDKIIGENGISFARNIISMLIKAHAISKPDIKYRPNFKVYVSDERMRKYLSFPYMDLIKDSKRHGGDKVDRRTGSHDEDLQRSC